MAAKLFKAAALASVMLAPAAAYAEGYSVSDLGNMASKEVCLQKAERVIRRYDSALGAGQINVANWTAYGWDMTPGDQDTLIICAPTTEAGTSRVRVILVVYGEQESEDRQLTRDVLKGYWESD